MGFFRHRSPIFTPEETERVLHAIRQAEQQTSGEIRVFVERRCKYVDAMDRARQIFNRLEMERTEARNGVLLYMATSDHQLAIFADEGIHKSAGDQFWKDIFGKVVDEIRSKAPASGLCLAIQGVGEALKAYFPFDSETDRNELPDDIVFGN